jgi:RNA polymerase sigma-70 factor (ECF subfamily)
VDDVRRRGRRPVAPAAPERIEAVAGAGGDVESEAHARMTDAAVRAAIEALPDDQRAVMLLRSLGDLTIEQVATALGKRVGAVKGLQRRALRRLEKAYPFDPGRR